MPSRRNCSTFFSACAIGDEVIAAPFAARVIVRDVEGDDEGEEIAESDGRRMWMVVRLGLHPLGHSRGFVEAAQGRRVEIL